MSPATTLHPHPSPLNRSAALSHHWLVRRRGGEKVLEAIGELLPEAPVYTLVHDADGMRESPLSNRPIHSSVLQWLPGITRLYPKLLPLLPWAARRMKLPPVDLVVCSDAAIAKAMTPQANTRVVCYCHSPMRYVWDLADEHRQTLPAPLRPLWGPLCRRLQRADRVAAQRIDVFVANSRHVADRIRRHYDRPATIVHPPVDLPAEPVTDAREDFYLCVGYHTPYKRLDLAVSACAAHRQQLVVIGTGPDLDRLDLKRQPNVRVLGWQPDQVVRDHLRRARALLFPGEEDFGIVPVEAMAHGCPVIAYGVGGATETVVPDETGVLFAEQSVDAVVAAMERCATLSLNPVAMHERMQRFSRPRFLTEMRDVLEDALAATA